MKKLIISLSLLLFALQAFAQSPFKMSYQAVVRDAANELVSNAQVGMQISVLQGSSTGTAVFVETHTGTTNENGLLSLEIGGGTIVSGSMADIDWSAGPYFLQTETDPTGGTAYSITGVSELASVPFALQTIDADTAQFALKAEFADSTNKASIADIAASAEFADSSNVAALAYSVVPKKKSIVFTPAMVNPSNMRGGVVQGNLSTGQPTIDFPENGGFPEFAISVPVPTENTANSYMLRVLYTSDSNTGDFDLATFVRGFPLDVDLSSFVGGPNTPFAPPSSANFMAEGIAELRTNGASVNARILHIIFRRRTASSNDTSTGNLRILGFILEYED
ncbi:MAG: hypothetical protein R8P61_23405 [Bacteroidia bacterium]|nr:hypothetical protein [Bacteroidia bacterium]